MSYRYGGVVKKQTVAPLVRLLTGPRRDVISAVLTYATLEVVILSVEQAKWLQSQPPLSLVLLLACIVAFILEKVRLREIVKWSLGVIAGLAVAAWQTYSLLPPSIRPWFEELADALRSSWGVFSMAQTDETSLHFALFLILLTWFLGYLSTRHVLRKQSARAVIIAGTAGILINLTNLPPQFGGFLFFFLGMSLVLLGYMKLVKSTGLPSPGTAVSRNRSMGFFLSSVVCISVLASTVTWLVPEITPTKLASIEPGETPVIKNIDEYLHNFFAKVPRKQPLITAEDQGELSINGTYERGGDIIHFVVTTDSPYYWRTWMYDVYQSSGWTNSEVTEHPVKDERSARSIGNNPGRARISFDVEVRLKTDIILSTGDFITTDIPASRRVLSSPESEVPETSFIPDTTVTVTSPHTLTPGQNYRVTADIISATPSELAASGDIYPEVIKQYYLQLPETLPPRIIEYSENITRNALTPYEKAMAISDNLSRFSYDLTTGTLPEGADAVEYFLCGKQSGACIDFASAMTVLLRAAGIPARLCTGYLPGEPENGTYIVLSGNRHAWAEVYFPGYGWVEFETTPGSGRTRGIVGVEAITSNGTKVAWDPYMYYEQYMYPTTGIDTAYTPPSRESHIGSSSIILMWPLLLLAAAILAALVISVLYLRKDRAGTKKLAGTEDYESEIYREMCELASQAGLGPNPSQTPLEYSSVLVAEFPAQSDSIAAITYAYQERRYASRENEKEPAKWDLVKARRLFFDVLRSRISGKG